MTPKKKAKEFAKRCRGESFRRMRWDTWVREFKPIEDKDGPRKFETFNPDWADVKSALQKNPFTVWTMVDTDGRNPIVASGCHAVNRIVYYICEKPYDGACFYEVSL